MKELPFVIDVFGDLGDPIEVRYAESESDKAELARMDAVAFFNPDRMVIVVEEGATGPRLAGLLIHEIMHVVETALLGAGVIKRRIPHAFITGMPGTFLLLMSAAGLLCEELSVEALLDAGRVEVV